MSNPNETTYSAGDLTCDPYCCGVVHLGGFGGGLGGEPYADLFCPSWRSAEVDNWETQRPEAVSTPEEFFKRVCIELNHEAEENENYSAILSVTFAKLRDWNGKLEKHYKYENLMEWLMECSGAVQIKDIHNPNSRNLITLVSVPLVSIFQRVGIRQICD